MRSLLTIFITALFLHSCDLPEDNQVFCTKEFRTISVTITGGELDDFYTLRKSTGDTIKYGLEDVPFTDTYPILDDGFQATIAKSEEIFDFFGLINAIIVVDEEYIISADECHINLVSGETEIDL